MSFHAVQFPTNISKGSRGGPGWGTTILERDNGSDVRIARRATAKRRWDVGYGVKSFDQLYSVYQFALARGGAVHGFRFKDPLDFSSSPNGRAAPAFTDQLLAVGDGSTTQFQLIKKYTSGPSTVTRNIHKPISGTVLSGVNGVQKTEGVDFTVDLETGTVTYAVAPPFDLDVTAGFQFDCAARFGSTADDWLAAAVEAVDTGSVPTIEVVEDPSPALLNEDVYFGGSQLISSAISLQVSPLLGKLCAVNMTAASQTVFIPAASNFPEGGEHLVLHNNGSNAWALKSGTTTIEASVPSGDKRLMYVQAPSGVATWLSVG